MIITNAIAVVQGEFMVEIMVTLTVSEKGSEPILAEEKE